MYFEHLIEVNEDPAQRALSADELWRGLVLRAEDPMQFVEAVSAVRIVARGEGWLEREVEFGALQVSERVEFVDASRVCYHTRPSEQHAGGEMTMTLEADAGRLFVRFVYDTPVPEDAALGEGMEQLAPYLKQAYRMADLDTVRTIRRLAEAGLLG